MVGRKDPQRPDLACRSSEQALGSPDPACAASQQALWRPDLACGASEQALRRPVPCSLLRVKTGRMVSVEA